MVLFGSRQSATMRLLLRRSVHLSFHLWAIASQFTQSKAKGRTLQCSVRYSTSYCPQRIYHWYFSFHSLYMPFACFCFHHVSKTRIWRKHVLIKKFNL